MTDRAWAIHVIANFKFLHLPTLAFHQSSDKESTDGISRISLFGICLDHHAFVHPRLVIGFVLVLIIWMDGVPHVATNQERLRDGLAKGSCRGRKTVKERRN